MDPNEKATTSRRYAVQIDTGDGDYVEICSSRSEGSANALAWLWAKHDNTMRIRVVDLRAGRETLSADSIALIAANNG